MQAIKLDAWLDGGARSECVGLHLSLPQFSAFSKGGFLGHFDARPRRKQVQESASSVSNFYLHAGSTRWGQHAHGQEWLGWNVSFYLWFPMPTKWISSFLAKRQSWEQTVEPSRKLCLKT